MAPPSEASSDETRDEPKNQRFHTPMFIDHVRDTIRSRLLAAVTITALFAVVLYLVFSVFFRSPVPLYGRDIPTSLSVVLVPSSSQSVLNATAMPSRTPFAKFQISNQRGFGVKDVRVTASISSFIVPLVSSHAVSCDPFDGDLNTQQYGFLCDVLTSPTAVTDQYGVASFWRTAFSNDALPGEYNVTFSAGSFSSSTLVRLSSPVTSLIFNSDFTLPTFIPVGANSSVPLNVTVVDGLGNPVPNRVVRVISRDIDGSYLYDADDYIPFNTQKVTYLPFPQANKFAVIDGGVGTSDAQGRVVFSDLAVAGATHPVAYLSVMCDGIFADLFTSVLAPSILVSEVETVTVVQPPSAEVIEGFALDTQPTVRVTDDAGEPVVGALVFALITARNGIPEPEFLLYKNPLEDLKVLSASVSVPTDDDGLAVFEDLAFSVGGDAGDYDIDFVCDGVPASGPTYIINVISSVASISVSYFPTLPIPVPFTESSLPVVAITDIDGRPVSGKTPQLVAHPRAHVLSNARPSLANGLAFFDVLKFASIDYDSDRGVDPAPFPPTLITFTVSVDSVNATFNATFVPRLDQYAAFAVPTWIEPVVPTPSIVLSESVHIAGLSLVNSFYETLPVQFDTLFNNPLQPTGLYFSAFVEFINSAGFVSTFEALSPGARFTAYNQTISDAGGSLTVFPYAFGFLGYTSTFSYQYSLGPPGSDGDDLFTVAQSDIYQAVCVNVVDTLVSKLEPGPVGFGPQITLTNYDDAPISGGSAILNVAPEISSDDIQFLVLLGEIDSPNDVFDSTVTGTTAANGTFVFDEVVFTPDVVGSVSMFAYGGSKVLSQLVTTSAPRRVANITIITPAAYFDSSSLTPANADVARFFAPFTTQPVVRLEDADGNPVVGARARIAVFNGDPEDYTYLAGSDEAYVGRVSVGVGEEAKVASMFSAPSDASGNAVFANMGFWFAPVPSKTDPATVRIRYFSDGSVDSFGDGPVADTGTPNMMRVLDAIEIRVVKQPSAVASLGVPFAQPIVVELVTAGEIVAPVSYADVFIVSGPEGALKGNVTVELPLTVNTTEPELGSAAIYTPNWGFQAKSRFTVDTYFISGPLGKYELAVSFPGATPVLLNPIEVTASPALVRIVNQPPLQVAVGGLFRVSVEAQIRSGAHLPGVPIKMRLIRGTTDVVAAVRLDQRNRNMLDPFRVTNTTGPDGVATLSLTIASAEPGVYVLVATAGNSIVASLPSIPFRVVNAISNVDILVQPTGLDKPILPTRTLNGRSETVLITSEGDQGVSTMRQPVVRVLGEVEGVAGQPMAGVAVEAVVVQSSTISSEGITITAEDLSRPNVVWTTVVSDENGIARFSDLRFSSGGTGAYRLLFRARGIDSVHSQAFLVTNVLVPDSDRLGSFRNFVFIVLVILLPLLYGNMTINHRLVLLVAAFFSAGLLALSFVFLAHSAAPSSPKDPFEITLNVGLAVVLIALILLFVWVFLQTLRRKPTFQDSREETAQGSVRRLLDPNYPAEFWDGRLTAAAESKVRAIRSKIADKVPDLIGDLIRPSPIDIHSNPFAPFETKADFVYPQRLIIAAFVSGFFIFVGFLGTIVTVLWVVFKSDEAFAELLRIDLLLEQQQQALEEAAAAGGTSGALSTALKASSSLTHYAVDLVNPDVYTELREALQAAGGIAVAIALVFVCVTWWLLMKSYKSNIFLLRRGATDRVMFNPDKFKGIKSPVYIGIQTMHTVVGFLTTFVLVWAILFLILFEPARSYAARKLLPILLSLLSLNLLMNIIQKLIIKRKVLWPGKQYTFFIPNPRWHALFELIYLFLNVINGVTLTIARLAGALGMITLTFLRTDFPVINKLFEHSDPGFAAYCAMLMLDHHHNHPVVVVACQLWKRSLFVVRTRNGDDASPLLIGTEEKGDVMADVQAPLPEPAQLRARARWHLAYTLIHNPQLAHDRFAAIEARRVHAEETEAERRATAVSPSDDDDLPPIADPVPAPLGDEDAAGVGGDAAADVDDIKMANIVQLDESSSTDSNTDSSTDSNTSS